MIKGDFFLVPTSTRRKRIFEVTSGLYEIAIAADRHGGFPGTVVPFVPDDYLDQRWPRLKTGGRRYGFSASQLWRLHLLALITPVHSFNLLIRMLPEQKAWRRFAHLPSQEQVPDVRMMNTFREEIGVDGLRQVNGQLLEPIIASVDWSKGAAALIDATDLPASCSGFKKKHRTLFCQKSRAGRAHAQERTKSMVRWLQEAHVSPLDFAV